MYRRDNTEALVVANKEVALPVNSVKNTNMVCLEVRM